MNRNIFDDDIKGLDYRGEKYILPIHQKIVSKIKTKDMKLYVDDFSLNAEIYLLEIEHEKRHYEYILKAIPLTKEEHSTLGIFLKNNIDEIGKEEVEDYYIVEPYIMFLLDVEFLRVENADILSDFQDLHDNSSYWEESGLSDIGRERLRDYIYNGGLDISDFSHLLT